VGRTTELREVAQRLHDPGCRLLTLLGPGGTGKSRLVQELVQREVEQYADGVFWVDLEPVRTEQSLVTAIAGALSLQLQDQSKAREQLLSFLEDKELLLALDNFEQLVDDSALLDELLQRGPGVQLLVTSRIPLHLAEEWLYPLAGLPYPAGGGRGKAWSELQQYDAVRLFVERVCQVRPDFSPQEERDGLLRICQLVEGMPLALELAAPWTRILSCAEIAAEIERNQSFLRTPVRNVPQRQRSMQAVFKHSWSLLDTAEQRLFRRLAVFRGGWDRSAAQAVAGTADGGTILGQLSALVDKSLLRREDGRYRMHGLLRQYAEQQLARSEEEAAETRRSHAVYYLNFLAQREAAFLGGGQRKAAEEVVPELENIRAAWRWAVEQQMWEAVTPAVEALAMFFHIKGRYLEAADVYEEALSNLDVNENPGGALLLCEAGWIAIRLGRFQKAKALYEQCQAVYEQYGLEPLPGQGTDPLLGLSTLASIAGDYERAQLLAKEAWQRATKQEHWHNLQTAHYQLASIAYAQGQYESAQSYAEAAYEMCQQTGDRWFMGYCLSELGRAERALGDLEKARRHFEASYELRESFSDPEGMALALNNLGEVALRQRQYDEAQLLFERSQSVYQATGDRGGWATARSGLARAALAAGRYEEARELLWEALEAAATIQYRPLLLSTLATVAAFLTETGRREAGAQLMALVGQHPATDQETKSLAQAQLEQMELASGRERSTVRGDHFAPDLTTAVGRAQRELSATVPTSPSAPSPGESSPLVEPLTERELEVLQLLAEGLTNREIAERLVVVTGTVKAHNNHIFGKLDVRNRTEAVMRARELGLL
jgi:predicted ATPase/DNA-binding CsgD family transcriptional regulator